MANDADSTAMRVRGMYFMNSPTMSGQNSSGKNAASVVAVDAMMGQAMRVAAAPYASRRRAPSAILRSAYSTTTIAPSTSIPTDRISANSTTTFTVSPDRYRIRIPVSSDPGTATPTRPAARGPRAQSITIMTSTIALTVLFCRSASIVRICSDSSCVKVTATLAGQRADSAATAARTAAMVSRMFSPVRLTTFRPTAACPPMRAKLSGSRNVGRTSAI